MLSKPPDRGCDKGIEACAWIRPDNNRSIAMSKNDLPPVPPAGRSNKGPGPADLNAPSDLAGDASDSRHRNIDKQGRQGNIKINTTNQGYQQDR